MLVWVDHDGVGLRYTGEGTRRLLAEGRGQGEVSPVGRIYVNAEWIGAAQREHFMERIDGAGSGGAQRHHHRANVSLL